MKCSKCGHEMAEGHLYCEHCGQEIQIVPDMDIEIENSIHETLSGLIEDISAGQKKTEGYMERGRRIRKRILMAIFALTVIILLILMYIGVGFYRSNSFDYQMKSAMAAAKEQDLEQAIVYLERAILLNEDDLEARLLLAEYYIREEKFADARQTLRDIIAKDGDNEEAYERLIRLYEAEQDYAAINRLLLNSDSNQMQEKFRRFLALEPEFSNAEGSYTEVVALKLNSHTSGDIYYTMDGSTPTKGSERYTTPIMLESGEYVISAVFINEYGIASNVVTKHYNIEVAIPLAPIVECMSGSYDCPTMISVEVPEASTVYYTMDGSEPTLDSIPYSVPIAMPLGNSCFKFVAYSEEGVASDVTTRNYLLRVHTSIDVVTAVNLLMQELKERGVILEFDGSVPNKSGKNVYIASTLIQIGRNNFFLVAEYYQDTIGTLTRTGSLYGVEAESGTIYKVTTDDKGNYLANPY
ncbi:MAG: tetratricopeptide repeat protein [Clostridiales bacterium]|nr:tetratricopeptide repeat protein [Clostridiales bacterium]